ncbi:MAG: pyruvate formate lyase family protein [Planctomycetota bacterium]|jgi:formate C-acetyltransferase
MLTEKQILDGLEQVNNFKKNQTELYSWFLFQKLKVEVREEMLAGGKDPDLKENRAELLISCIEKMEISIPKGSVLAGTQDDAFSPSYALINPSFKVETFAGYCDPLAVYNDIKPASTNGITAEDIEKVKSHNAETPYVKALAEAYAECAEDMSEIAYFVEQVTGHTIPDFRPILEGGIKSVIKKSKKKSPYCSVIKSSLEAAVILAEKYSCLAEKLAEKESDNDEKARLLVIAENCKVVPAEGAQNLHQAIQSFVLLWQVMCLEQAPNPYAFSVGNLDRILQPYLKGLDLNTATALVRHLLAFYMVADRGWAISQNIMVGGMDEECCDHTCDMTYAVLDAFYQSNTPQPALSIKLHSGTPEKLYEETGKFFFTPGKLTPSLFNDSAIFQSLMEKGVAFEDFKDYSIAGCQEPLIMGKENANTTNSWLNLPKIMELTINNGCSLLTNKKIGLNHEELGYKDGHDVLQNLKEAFFKQLDYFLPRMEVSGNKCTAALEKWPMPFTSAVMGCLESGRDIRNAEKPGTKYNASGCLIHGLSVVADSLHAVEKYLSAGIGTESDLVSALQKDFKGFEEIQAFLINQDKYGNNITEIDNLTVEICNSVCEKVSALRNPAGAPFQADFSSPSTHLLYGYWVGATPDGRGARTMLGYGIDPRPGMSRKGLEERILSNQKLPFKKFRGGYASHFGINPNEYKLTESLSEKGSALAERVVKPLLRFDKESESPFYIYFNIDEASQLRKVLADPETFAPDGVYIMRIHGTFVNFLDLSPAIQEDIIERLEVE